MRNRINAIMEKLDAKIERLESLERSVSGYLEDIREEFRMFRDFVETSNMDDLRNKEELTDICCKLASEQQDLLEKLKEESID